MGCIASKRDVEDSSYSNVFQVMNVDEHGNHIKSGKLEVTDLDLVLYQQGKSPIKWPLRTLRRYGFDTEHFSFESGRRCPTGPGIYAFRCSRSEQIFNLLQSRILLNNIGETETTDTTNNLEVSLPRRDCMYLEPAHLRHTVPGSRFSSQSTRMIRLSSVGSASGSVGPLSPQSVKSAPLPLDSFSFIQPLPACRPLSQNLYANEEITAAFTQELEEKNNNNTVVEPVSPPVEHSYLNSTALDLLPDEATDNLSNENNVVLEDASSPIQDSHLYMNIIPGTDKVVPLALTQSPETQRDGAENLLPNYANIKADPNEARKAAPEPQSLNYIVLDLEPREGLPKSPTGSLPSDITKKPSQGYAAIDFQKTVALSNSTSPNIENDTETFRKTRHNSSNKNSPSHEGQSSSVSE